MLLILLLLFTIAVQAQTGPPSISGLWVSGNLYGSTMDDRTCAFGFTLSAGDPDYDIRVNLGTSEGRPATDTAAAYASAGWWRDGYFALDAVVGTDTARYWSSPSCIPATTHYFSLEVSDSDGGVAGTWSGEMTCPVTCTNCTSGDDALFGTAPGGSHSNISCTTGENPRFTTAAEDSGIPVAPTAPTHGFSATVPAYDTLRDGGDTASSLDSMYTTAESNVEATGDTDRIGLTPATGYGRGFSIRNLTQGHIQFAGDNYDNANAIFTPAGARVDKTMAPYMPWFRADPDDPTTWLGSYFTNATNGGQIDFLGVVFGPPDHTQVDKVSLSVTDVTANVVTVSDASLVANNVVVLTNFNGTGLTSANGPYKVCNKSGNTFNLCDANSNVQTLTGWSSGGKVDSWVSQPISGHAACTAAPTSEQCITVTGHGMGEYAQLTITGNSGAATVTMGSDPSTYQIDTTRAVLIRNSTDASCNGRWTVTGTTASSVTMSGAGLDCSAASDGTIQVIDSVVVWGVAGAGKDAIGSTAHRKVWHWTVEDANTLRLWGSTADATLTGGYITWEVTSNGNAVFPGFGSGTIDRQLRIDRSMFLCGFPWRCGGQFMLLTRTDGVSITNSLFEKDIWIRVDPISGDNQTVVYDLNDFFELFTTQNNIDFQFLNNAWIGESDLYGDESSELIQDGTLSGNLFFTKRTWPLISDTFEGLYRWKLSIGQEWKSATRVHWIGNYWKGKGTPRFSTQDMALEITGGWPSDDDLIQYNTFEAGANGLMIDNQTEAGLNQKRQSNQRIRVSHNLLIGQSDDYQNASDGNAAGNCLFQWSRIIDYHVDHNACVDWTGGQPRVVSFDTGSPNRGQGGLVEKNIFLASFNGTTGGFQFSGSVNDVFFRPPYDETDAADKYLEYFQRGGVDNDGDSVATDNWWIPCVHQDSSTSDSGWLTLIASTADASTVTRDEFLSATYDSVIGGLATTANAVGSAGTGDGIDSCLDRMNTVWDAGTFNVKAGYTGYGPDIAAMNDAQGWTADVQVSRSRTAIRVDVTGPTTDGCTVDIVPTAGTSGYADLWDGTPAIDRVTDGGGSKTQTFNFTGKTPGAQYQGRVFCKEKLDIRPFTMMP